MSVAAIFELATPFTEADLPQLSFEQNADLVVIFKMGMAIKRLRRFDHYNWILDNAPIGPTVVPPASVTVTPAIVDPSDPDYVGQQKNYVITSVNDAGQESRPSPIGSGINDLNLKGNHNVITWPAVTGIRTFRVYEHRGGMYGYLGTVTDSLAFKDDNILGNFAEGPPQNYNPFTPAASNGPHTGTFHESRLWAARQLTLPNVLYASRIDDIFNFDVSKPTRATDAIAVTLRARKQNAIRHMVSMKDLIVLTGDMIWSIRATGDSGLGPLTMKRVPEKYQGCGVAKPEIVGDIFFYTSPRGNSIHTGGYTFEKDGYRGNNLCVFSQHLFDRFEIKELAWCESPSAIMWGLRNDGKLAALTWLQEQDVWGWTLCYTAGHVESICSVPEQGRDALYALVRRDIGGQVKRYVERLAAPVWMEEGWDDLAGAICLDCSDYIESDTAFNEVAGLWWLEGEDVTCLGDGTVYRGHTVVGGVLTPPLPNRVNRLVVGLPYDAYIQTLPLVTQTQQGSTKGFAQNISKVFIDFINTAGFADGLLIGANLDKDQKPDLAVDRPELQETQTPYDPWTGLLESEVENGDWGQSGVTIWQTDPLPMVVCGIHFDVEANKR